MVTIAIDNSDSQIRVITVESKAALVQKDAPETAHEAPKNPSNGIIRDTPQVAHGGLHGSKKDDHSAIHDKYGDYGDIGTTMPDGEDSPRFPNHSDVMPISSVIKNLRYAIELSQGDQSGACRTTIGIAIHLLESYQERYTDRALKDRQDIAHVRACLESLKVDIKEPPSHTHLIDSALRSLARWRDRRPATHAKPPDPHSSTGQGPRP